MLPLVDKDCVGQQPEITYSGDARVPAARASTAIRSCYAFVEHEENDMQGHKAAQPRRDDRPGSYSATAHTE